MKTLHLNLKRKWYDLILSGEKKEEYREIKEYWAVRLIQNWNEFSLATKNILLRTMNNTAFEEYELKECVEINVNEFNQIHFKNGMARNGIDAPAFDIELNSISVGQGKVAWGAEKDKRYFVLKLGEIIK